MDLSIIIVNYNTKELLKQTIQSVIDNTQNISYEIIVVDNASVDGSCDMVNKDYPQVKVIKNTDNLGFPKANNKGIKIASGRYVMLLNSDTYVLENCLESCINYMDKYEDIGALGCKLVLANGELDHACKRGFPTPEASLYYLLKLDKLFPEVKKFGQYKMSYVFEDEISEVDSLTGAFMIVKREVIKKIGVLDETFFMYGEDIDWCYRIKEAGYKVMYYPEVRTIHYKGQSSKKKRLKTIYEFHRAMYIFYNKHYYKKYNFLVTLFVYIGITLRLMLALLVNIFKRKTV
ncbi:glycosyltransferase family 2 protein [Clostridium aestuarii]|uniref:Glycosyltransferase family 2 protein n=1 Tax=Clostridium aestuarii TaxID=338193 RepID=A0ABT4D2L9_9CLOT|nr:glycosyltransferase family 2 protein [Clostridium aestuarii]MCY6484520.1 glycosyltransferase family 2 protein [Clostridium aestuarii]